MGCATLCTSSASTSSSLRRHVIPLSPPPLNTISFSFSTFTTNPQSSYPYSSTCCSFRNRHNVNPSVFCNSLKPTTIRPCKYVRRRFNCSGSSTEMESEADVGVDSVGAGLDVKCAVDTDSMLPAGDDGKEKVLDLREWMILVSPFFFWGTAMVAMKDVLPRTGPFFVPAFRLIPAGLLLVAFAAYKERPMPSGLNAWLSIALFALVDATCFQGFLAQGLQRTSAGLGSVIIDSQPLTVALLAALLFGESIGLLGAAGLILGVVGILLLEVPALSFDESNFSLWGSGEWWMLLAAQSMAVGTVMVRWVSKYSDPVMATGWHMVIGGLPLAVVSFLNHDPALSGSFNELSTTDILALLYTSFFGSCVSYGVYYYSATRGSLTKLSSLTFLTPVFASIFGFLYLSETFSPLQLVGATVTLVGIYMVNYRDSIR